TSPAILIAAIVIPIVVLLLLLSCVIFYKKVYLKHEKKSDMESQSASGIKNEASSDCEESRGLLHRVSTLPSKQTLGHLDQRNDDSLSDPTLQGQNKTRKMHLRNSDGVYMNELRESIQRHSLSEKNINQDSKISSPSPAPDEPSFTISDPRAKENGKPYEAEPRDAVEENVLEDDPSDSERMNETLPAEAAEYDDKVQMDADELGNDMEVKRSDPTDSENGKDVLAGISDQHSPDKNKDEDNRDSSPPEVPQKSNIVLTFSALQKEKDRNMQPKVVKRQNDPADSGNAKDKLAAGSDNQSE
ncbi:hypothetical protein ATANTOWER_020429, partial [Ataeniobius toweri]|nr:hypothetical protein [Ataeniobius toweri]